MPWSSFETVLPYVNDFYFDIKAGTRAKYAELIGGEISLIENNLRKLVLIGANVTARIPLIPGVNDTPEHFRGIALLTKNLPRIRQVDLLPYHALGNNKRSQLGLSGDGFRVPDEETVQRWFSELSSLCHVPVCR